MATKPTIYRFAISLSDMNREHYETLNLTVAQHPSETNERMLVRVLAFCLNAQDGLKFTDGLSSPDTADLWARTLHDSIELWIDVGEPAAEKIKKATRQSPVVKVYSFNSKASVWWTQNQESISSLPASVYKFAWPEVQKFATLLERTMDMSISISGESAYISAKLGDCEVTWQVLQANPDH